MANEMNERPNNERYAFLLTTIIDKKEVWLLKAREGFYAMFEDSEEHSYLPVWPEKSYADTYATGDWDEYESEAMALAEFMEWLPELKEDTILIGAFPNAASQSMAIDPLAFKKQLISLMKSESIQKK